MGPPFNAVPMTFASTDADVDRNTMLYSSDLKWAFYALVLWHTCVEHGVRKTRGKLAHLKSVFWNQIFYKFWNVIKIKG